MRKERIAVIDGGGRGHVLLSKYLKSNHVESGIAIPGNDFMKIGQTKPAETFQNVATTDVNSIISICQDRKVTFVDVAQDNAVRAGLVDALRKAGIRALGPTAEAGKIEWDKVHARIFGERNALPQPEFKWFLSEEAGIDEVMKGADEPRFIKAAGLCEGKGSFGAETRDEAVAAIKKMKYLKDNAGRKYLVEKWLRNDDGSNGEEFSSHAVTDGNGWKVIGLAQDHKKSLDHDRGEMTGGMGCVSPPLVADGKIKLYANDIFKRAIFGMGLESNPYTGILYLSGMVVKRGGAKKVYVIEFNARWGDPEAQAIVPGIKTDLFEIGCSAVSGRTSSIDIVADCRTRVVVAGVSPGYPGNYDVVRGRRIHGLEDAQRVNGVELYGAGLKVEDSKYYANGGRLFYVVAEGSDVIMARERAYAAISHVFIDGIGRPHYRTDIGWRDMERLLRE
ncbi:MAG: phosphoribosylamine--glycine ligase [Candidatus Micrarchaeota archaeon]|nr:phosphoribosylamine--glycine ligase [Candidatus Micrarchaeota archaeon]